MSVGNVMLVLWCMTVSKAVLLVEVVYFVMADYQVSTVGGISALWLCVGFFWVIEVCYLVWVSSIPWVGMGKCLNTLVNYPWKGWGG